MGLLSSRTDVSGVRFEATQGVFRGECPCGYRCVEFDWGQAYWLINSVKIYAV